jgi:hypothetical protein
MIHDKTSKAGVAQRLQPVAENLEGSGHSGRTGRKMPHLNRNPNLVLLNTVISKYNSVKDGEPFTDANNNSRFFISKTAGRQ